MTRAQYILALANPTRGLAGYAWWPVASHQRDPEDCAIGCLPHILYNLIECNHTPPKGNGGKWFDSHSEALSAMETALVKCNHILDA